MTLWLPVGPPGAGKTTLRRWAVLNGLITENMVICPDDLRYHMTNNRSDQSANANVFAVVNLILRERLKRDLSVWLDATNLNGLSDLLNTAATHGQPSVLITFEFTEQDIYLRNTERKESERVPDAVITRMLSRWDNMKYTIGSGFNNTKIMTETELKEAHA